MKKTIVILFLAISFVMMVLISFMKFQATLNLQSSEPLSRYEMDSSHFLGSEFDLLIGH